LCVPVRHQDLPSHLPAARYWDRPDSEPELIAGSFGTRSASEGVRSPFRLPPDSPRIPRVTLPTDQRTDEALRVLHSVFGYDAFRGDQREIIEQVIGGGDALGLMPTGGGQSLCYQIPALVRAGAG